MVNSQAYEANDGNEVNTSSSLTYTIGNGLQLSPPQQSRPQNDEGPANGMRLGYVPNLNQLIIFLYVAHDEALNLDGNTLNILSNLQQIATVDCSRWVSLKNPMNNLSSHEKSNPLPDIVLQVLKIKKKKSIQGRATIFGMTSSLKETFKKLKVSTK